MEKRKPHYALAAIQAQMVAVEGLRMTRSAAVSCTAIGWSLSEAVQVVQSLSARAFYKSMTTHFDPRIWQDVYHAEHLGEWLYVKFQRDEDGYFTISFNRFSDGD